MHKRTIIGCLFLVIGFFLIVPSANASQVFLETANELVGVGQKIRIDVRIDSEGRNINAVEGVIQLPDSILFRSVKDANSVISFWVKEPASQGQNISFAGIIAGGWKGEDGHLFSLDAETTEPDDARVSFSNVHVFLHDGRGTPDRAETSILALQVDEDVELFSVPEDDEDREAPESFMPLLASDPSVFSGDSFLVFKTQDRDSGIDYYEVQERAEPLKDLSKGKWEVVESPYRLRDQTLRSYVYIRAVDKAGNIRVTVFEPPLFDVRTTLLIERNVFRLVLSAAFVGVMSGVAIILLLYLYRFWKDHKRRQAEDGNTRQ